MVGTHTHTHTHTGMSDPIGVSKTKLWVCGTWPQLAMACCTPTHRPTKHRHQLNRSVSCHSWIISVRQFRYSLSLSPSLYARIDIRLFRLVLLAFHFNILGPVIQFLTLWNLSSLDLTSNFSWMNNNNEDKERQGTTHLIGNEQWALVTESSKIKGTRITVL